MSFSIKKIQIKNIYGKFISVILAVLLLLTYCANIHNVCTVWELVDEAGYLANVAYITGYDWDDVRSVLPYYGYGYSILLIPIFHFTQTGVALIQGAIGVNICLVLGIYVLQIYILQKIFKKKDLVVYSGIAFIMCICPYIISNTYKVNCEVFFTFWFLLIIAMIYNAIEKRKLYIYCILGICSAYSFFIHTRAFVIIFAVVVTLLWEIKKNNDTQNCKNLISFAVSFLIFGAIFYGIKLSIVNSAQVLSISVDNSKVSGNLLTISYLEERLKWLFNLEDIKFYFLSFVAKIFYIIYATGTMAVWGYIELLNSIRKQWNEKLEKDSVCAVYVFMFFCVTLMVGVCTINGAGMLENFTTFFYNRYYEFAIWPLFGIGVYKCVSHKQNIKKYSLIGISIGLLCVVLLQLNAYLCSNEIHIDTCRIAAFSAVVNRNKTFEDLVWCLTLTMFLLLGIFFWLNQKFRVLILFVLVWFISCSSIVCLKTIIQVNKVAESDAMVAEYILADDGEKKVYMINEPDIYDYFYSRMQVLIKNKPLYVIEPNEIKNVDSGDYILTYSTTKYEEMLEESSDYLTGEGKFYLYEKR